MPIVVLAMLVPMIVSCAALLVVAPPSPAQPPEAAGARLIASAIIAGSAVLAVVVAWLAWLPDATHAPAWAAVVGALLMTAGPLAGIIAWRRYTRRLAENDAPWHATARRQRLILELSVGEAVAGVGATLLLILVLAG